MFSRDSILKQEEALTDLDTSIDDWASKLEEAESRRQRIRRKLLEHTAAMATVKTERGHLSTISREQTPPMSPAKTDDAYKSERRDVQSIKIYADSGVTALLAEIEQQIHLAEGGDVVQVGY